MVSHHLDEKDMSESAKGETEESSKSDGRAAHEDSDEETQLGEDFIDDLVRGMIYASLAITDDKEKTLKIIGKTNPWQVEAMKIITGCSEKAHQPLTKVLKENMDLDIDCHIDVSGMTIGGHFLDTQGYIAHNDKFIVLSYRCTTSAYDWLTNFNTTSSAWEPEEDLALGFSGCCSGFEGLCCTDEYKPRVHTGFYNNFLASLPLIKQHIDPMLAPDQPPRNLFVVGHSLGGGVASLAAVYFLMGYDWTVLPHSFTNVTAGSPRACAQSMKRALDERLAYLGKSAKVYRIVKGRDVVVTVPPSVLGFQHMVKPVVIKDNGQIVLKRNYVQVDTDATTLMELAFARSAKSEEDEKTENESVETTKYSKMVSKIPRSLRDHMPDFYLRPLFQAKGIQFGVQLDRPVLEKTRSDGKEPDESSKRSFFSRLFRKRSTPAEKMMREKPKKRNLKQVMMIFKRRKASSDSQQCHQQCSM